MPLTFSNSTNPASWTPSPWWQTKKKTGPTSQSPFPGLPSLTGTAIGMPTLPKAPTAPIPTAPTSAGAGVYGAASAAQGSQAAQQQRQTSAFALNQQRTNNGAVTPGGPADANLTPQADALSLWKSFTNRLDQANRSLAGAEAPEPEPPAATKPGTQPPPTGTLPTPPPLPPTPPTGTQPPVLPDINTRPTDLPGYQGWYSSVVSYLKGLAAANPSLFQGVDLASLADSLPTNWQALQAATWRWFGTNSLNNLNPTTARGFVNYLKEFATNGATGGTNPPPTVPGADYLRTRSTDAATMGQWWQAIRVAIQGKSGFDIGGLPVAQFSAPWLTKWFDASALTGDPNSQQYKVAVLAAQQVAKDLRAMAQDTQGEGGGDPITPPGVPSDYGDPDSPWTYTGPGSGADTPADWEQLAIFFAWAGSSGNSWGSGLPTASAETIAKILQIVKSFPSVYNLMRASSATMDRWYTKLGNAWESAVGLTDPPVTYDGGGGDGGAAADSLAKQYAALLKRVSGLPVGISGGASGPSTQDTSYAY